LSSSRPATMNCEGGPQLGRPIMRRLIATIALLALVDTSVAIAQTVGSLNPSAPPIDEPGQAIAAGGTGRPPPAARRSSALGEKPDG
jgi:hypothetical protein